MFQRPFVSHLMVLSIAAAVSHNAMAADISTTDLLNLLVAEGVITEEKAVQLVKAVRSRKEKAEQLANEPTEINANTVRIPYIPDSVKNEIRDSVEAGLRTKVTEDVVAQAKSERWGVPDALPEWVNKIKVSGDVRLRYENIRMDEGNLQPTAEVPNPSPILNINGANDVGGRLSRNRDVFYNVRDDRSRLRARARLNVKAKVTQGVDVGLRLVTGNSSDPVSANQTLAGYDGKWESSFDQAYIKYTSLSKSLTLQGGKFKNPFMHTDLVWDSDFNFEGLAATWYMMRKDHIEDDFRQMDPFIIVGAFPLDEINQYVRRSEEAFSPDSNSDKWLYGFQVGMEYDFFNQSRFSAGLAYYKYDNIRGIKNQQISSDLYNVTAAPSFQFGNLTQNLILNADNNLNPTEIYGLASDYELLNATIKYDYAGFAPYHVWVELDMVKNLGFEKHQIAKRLQVAEASIPDRENGYQLSVAVGWPELSQRGNWRAGLAYRRLEGDAVIDAFADSDFLLGGTNAKGYMLWGDYAIMENVQLGAKWLSATEIDAAPDLSIGVDTLQLDLKTDF